MKNQNSKRTGKLYQLMCSENYDNNNNNVDYYGNVKDI